jgi:hypothetical protein
MKRELVKMERHEAIIRTKARWDYISYTGLGFGKSVPNKKDRLLSCLGG